MVKIQVDLVGFQFLQFLMHNNCNKVTKMKKTCIKSCSIFLSILILIGMIPLNIFLSSAAGQQIGSLEGISGLNYTSSTLLAQKLDEVFKGDIPIYSDRACTKKVNIGVGSYGVMPGENRYISKQFGWSQSCFAYAHAVYHFLFNDYPSSERSNSVRIPASGSLRRNNLTYNDFVNWGIKTGSYFRTERGSGSGHSLIILSYSQDNVTYVDGNWSPSGFVAIRVCSWKEFNSNISYGGRFLDHIVSPRDEYYYGTFFMGSYLKETSCNKYLQTVKDDVIVRDGPGKKYVENRRISTKGTIVHLVKQYINEYGNLWYKTDDGKWIYSERLTNRTKYTITYKNNFGLGNVPSQSKYRGDTINITTAYPYRRGFIFLGWSTSPFATSPTYYAGQPYSDNKSITLYAVYRPELTVINLSGYSLDLNLSGTKTKSVTSKLSGWVLDSYKYKITSQNGNCSATIDEHILGISTIKVTATKPGNDVITVSVIDSDKKVCTVAMISVDITEEYKVSYNANGGTGAPSTQTKKYNKNLSLSANIPTKTGYDFMGWSTSSNSTTPEYGPGDILTANKNTTLYAVWEKSKTFTSTFDSTTGTLTIYGEGNMPCYGSNVKPEWTKYSGQAKNLVISSGITSVGSFAFYGFSELTYVQLPWSVKKLGSYSFGECPKLLEYTAASDISIGSYAFSKCTSLKKATTKSSTKSSSNITSTIGAFAFEGCTSLEIYDIPDTTTEIGESAFQGCTSLKELLIPDTVTSIDDTAFFNCSSLEDINIPESITTINAGVFQGCSSLPSINIPENITEIGDQAFSGCTAIESVSIPETVENIGDSVFSNCTSLTTVELPDDITTLGDGMFSGCTALQSIEIPESVTNLGDGTFTGCTKLESVNIPEGVNNIGNSLFDGCSNLTSVEIPDSVGAIDSYAFYECTSLENVVLSEGLTEIGSCAFAECSSLQSVIVPESVTTLGMGAFMNCSSLDEVNFTNNAISIEDEAFAGCTALESIEIPEQATFVSQNAFSDCSSQLSITCYSTSDALSGVEQNNVNCNVIYPVSEINLNTENANLNKDETMQLVATVVPSNATNTNIIWISENEEIATVDSNGSVTAVGSGETIIKAVSEDGEFVASCAVNCVIPVEGISIRDKYEQLYVGNTLVLDYDFAPIQPTNIDVSWYSSNSDVVYVNNEGLITVNGVGLATITVTTEDGGYSDSFTVNTEEYVQVEQIVLDKTLIELKIGDTATITSTVYPSNATEGSTKYYSVDESVATIDTQGNVTAISVGETSIVYYTVDGLEVSCKVIVLAPESNYTFSIQSPSRTEIRHKDGIKLHTNIEGTAPAGSYVVWTTSNGKFKTEEINNGNSLKIVSDSNGKTTFTATLYSADGEVLATDSIEMKSKAGFFDKLGSFFRSLFGTTKTYDE